ncbi:LacI family transcriptional regulator [Microbacterium luteolum]|uniref:LacI family transcriptional regulator n=1 Tax=Microbacterium luteolum TaxID=69367 RepID=A0ABY7XUB5_MICLT|nr:LacI family DNA-binding transcriptional regulator [Microbacterium luteolum]WDM44345.1 LacI family transcriptional regulator [Microbacterium luteolum]
MTLVDVAAQAGVSVSSASRALTDKSASVDVRERVQLAARELGYVPDSTARSLKLGASRQVLFAVDDIGNPNYVAMLRAIERTFGYTGPRVSVATVGRDSGTPVDLVEAVSRGRADGLILSPIRRSSLLEERLSSSAIPTVVIGSVSESVQVDSVRIDSGKAIAIAAEHLIARGRRRIAFINGPSDTNPGEVRARGFAQSLRVAGIAADPMLEISAADFTVGAGVVAAHALFERGNYTELPFDAIVAANDLLAMAAINVAVGRGFRVPDDVAVTGLDDTELGSVFIPSITSVSLRAAERGARAAQMLEARFQHPQRPIERVAFEPELHVRASCGGAL